MNSEHDRRQGLFRISIGGLSVVLGTGLVSLLAWTSGLLIIARGGTQYVPIAPSTAVCFIILGGSLLLYIRRPEDRAARMTALVGAGLTLTICSILLVANFRGTSLELERLGITSPASHAAFPLGHMSPLTAAAFLAAASGAVCLIISEGRKPYLRQAAAFFASIAGFIGFMVALGYLHGTPFLYGGDMIPVALPTAITFVIFSLGFLAAAGPQVSPVGVFIGPTFRSRLLRAFLPTVIALVLMEGIIQKMTPVTASNPALISALTALLSMIIVGFIISKIATSIGDEIDRAHEEQGMAEAALRSSEKKYRHIFEHVQDVFYQTDGNGNFVDVSPSVLRYSGYSREELIGKPAAGFYRNPEDRGRLLEALRQKGEVSDYEIVMKARDGRLVHASLNAHFLFGPQGQPVGVEGVLRDITERKMAEEELRRSEEKYKDLVDSTLDGIYRTDAENNFTLMNYSGARMLGYEDPYEVIGSSSLAFWRDLKDRDAYWEALLRDKRISAYHVRARKRDGEPLELEISSRMIEDANGNFLGIEGILRDVTERKRMEEQLLTLSLTDDLTGLYNRRGLLALGEHELKMADRLKRGMHILAADMDGLKAINDTLGHQEGDKAIIDLATILKECCRNVDITARVGGDEFVVVPIGMAGDDVSPVLDRIQQRIEQHNAMMNRGYTLSLSMGTAYYDPENACSLEDLLLRADKAMYEVKKGRKARNSTAKRDPIP